MNRNPATHLRRLLAAMVCALALAAPSAAQSAASAATRPNIVFVLLDDAGFSDLGSYGGEIETPNLDQLARSGLRFTNFHTASTCEASRAMLHSGVDNHRAGAGTLQAAIAENQKGKAGYEGHLSDSAHSVGQLMKDAGYATYFAGKWNLGEGLARAPGTRGWDRYLALEQTGADNFEARIYAPLNMQAVWWEDGQRARLPGDFFSTKHYVDRMIRYIEDGRPAGKPFFSVLAFQAVHSPLQAPQADIDKYVGRYDAGWEKVRAQRYRRQVEMGLMPAGLQLPKAQFGTPWDRLSESERRRMATKMAVFAGMLDNVDQHIGRFREYLEKAGLLENTVFIVMSDNGADAYDLSRLNLPFRLWYMINRDLSDEHMGGRGSYVHYTQDWAEVSNTPLALFKGTAAEGGMRVPFFISWPGRIPGDRVTSQFAYATDFLPTVLDIAGVPMPGDEHQGRKLHRPTGASLLPHAKGESPTIHAASDVIGYESTGGVAIFRGDHKLVRDAPPAGDARFHLYNLREDPTERRDLAASQPAVYRELLAEVDRYFAAVGVVVPEPGYDGLRQVLMNNWRVLARQMWPILAGALAVFGLSILALAFWVRRVLARRRG